MVNLSTLALAVASILRLASARACTSGLNYCGYNLVNIGNYRDEIAAEINKKYQHIKGFDIKYFPELFDLTSIRVFLHAGLEALVGLGLSRCVGKVAPESVLMVEAASRTIVRSCPNTTIGIELAKGCT
ncbi:hypothetical protein B0T14DRAFT_501209 [Immersiella caudata]|uniref:Uncharacterized protein n=1 Tax=Immersiella caudata TaxID=314043 RepID=A0AA39TG45_9PEZI|nr:hypothetical protein B0T14DRAFT_501209 [Immersiella caudata]